MHIMANISALNALNNLRVTYNNKSKTMEKLSSGFRINRAADDAAGLAISEKMRRQIRGLEQASRNIQDSISLIQTAEGAMQEIHAILQRMNQLAVQSANEIYSESDRANIQLEFAQLRSEINNIAGNTNFNGKKLLNGDFSLHTDKNYTQIMGSKVLSGAIIINGSNDSFNFSLENGSFPLLLNHGSYTPSELLEHMNVQFSSNSIELRASLVNGNLAFSRLLAGEYPIDQISGSGMNLMINAQQGTQSKYVVAGEALLTPFITITAGVNDTLTFEVNGVAYSITIEEGTYATHMYANPDTSPLAMEINSKLQEQNIPVVAGYGGFVGGHPSLPGDINSACLTLKGNVASISNIGGSARNTLLGDLWKNQLEGGSPSSIFGSSDLSEGLEIIAGINDEIEFEVNGTIRSFLLSAGEYDASSLMNELNSQFSADNIVASLSGGKLVLTQTEGASMAVKGGGLSKELFFSYLEGLSQEELLAQGITIQTGANAGDTLTLDMPDVTGLAIGVSNLDISTASGASSALAALQDAINQVSSGRSRLGAYQNRLEHTYNNVLNYAENLSAAESRIRDADWAKEMVELTKTQILAEAGQAMLAQANAVPQSVLKLLV